MGRRGTRGRQGAPKRPGTRAIAVGALALAAGAALLVPSGADAAAPSYVALGDSYSSGTGTRSYISDGTSCQRSVYAYPSLIATARGYALSLRACSGATVADVKAYQVPALSSSTSYATVSVGGNDAGFADVITECAQPSWMSDCYGAIDRAQQVITGVLPARLDDLYASMHARAPQARVTVVGYPRLFNGTDCNAGTWFSSGEMSRLNQTADLLDSTISGRAAAAGFTFTNPVKAFVGHAVCDTKEWVNGLSYPVTESYHPNRAGHARGYTPLVSPTLTGATVTASSTLLRAARESSATLAADAEQWAGVDASISPEQVRAPDLRTAQARRAAARAGVDLSDPASIDVVDARVARQQHRAWLARR